jgi:hypothetical protein
MDEDERQAFDTMWDLPEDHNDNQIDVECWTSERPEWQAAAIKVGKHRYQQCLDSLEGLIVSRMFELTKMNMSQTGIFSSFFFVCAF